MSKLWIWFHTGKNSRFINIGEEAIPCLVGDNGVMLIMILSAVRDLIAFVPDSIVDAG